MPEGAEPPPRGVKVAAAVRWLLLLGMAALAFSVMWKFWGPRTDAQEHAGPRAPDRYYCPMHPQIRSPDPGECPICHMNLEPIPADRLQPTGPMSAAAAGDGGATTPSTQDAGGGDVSNEGGALGDGGLQGVVPVTLTLERQQLVGVVTAPVGRRVVGESLRVPAVAEVPEGALAQVHVRVPGFIERVAVRETGVRVSEGQVLAWYYSPQIYQAEQELLATQRWSRTELPGENTAHTDAGAPGVVSTIAMQSAEMQLAAHRNLELLGLSRSDIEGILRDGVPMRAVPIRAPRAGYVTQRAAVLGLYAQPETVLYEIADLSRVWVIASLYERDLSRVRRGMPARFVQASDEPLAASVDLIEPEVSSATRTARVRLVVDNPQLRLRPGQYGDVVFDLPAASALVVPRDAVIDTGQQQYVYVDRGEGRFEPRLVRVGSLFGEDRQVLDGLREGERVVTRGNFMLDAESRLQAALSEVPVTP